MRGFQCVYQESHYKGAVLKVISKLLLLSMHVHHDQKVKCTSFPSPCNLNAWHRWSNWKKWKKTQIWIYVLNINSKTKTFHKPIIAACDEFIFDLWIPACIVQHCNMSLWKVRVTYSAHVYEKEIIKYHQKGAHNKLVSPCLKPSENFCVFSMIITCANFQWYESN